MEAAHEGLLPTSASSKDLLILNTSEELLRALESKEWGRPLALGTVIVCLMLHGFTYFAFAEEAFLEGTAREEADISAARVPHTA